MRVIAFAVHPNGRYRSQTKKTVLDSECNIFYAFDHETLPEKPQCDLESSEIEEVCVQNKAYQS